MTTAKFHDRPQITKIGGGYHGVTRSTEVTATRDRNWLVLTIGAKEIGRYALVLMTATDRKSLSKWDASEASHIDACTAFQPRRAASASKEERDAEAGDLMASGCTLETNKVGAFLNFGGKYFLSLFTGGHGAAYKMAACGGVNGSTKENAAALKLLRQDGLKMDIEELEIRLLSKQNDIIETMTTKEQTAYRLARIEAAKAWYETLVDAETTAVAAK